MKIISSNLSVTSEHQFEQQDLSISQKRVESSPARTTRPPVRPDGLPMRLVDRFSVSRQEDAQYRSNYRTAVSGRSRVNQPASDDAIVYEQDAALEKLVGGLIHKEVVLRKMQRGEDVVLENGDSIQPDAQTLPENRSMTGGRSWEMSLRQSDIHFEQERLSVSSSGQVLTEDGRTIDFSLDLSFDRTFVSRKETQVSIRKWQQAVDLTDPLVISLDGGIPQLSDAWFEFDLDADGEADHINFVKQGSGFLAFDRNEDGRINDGSELFGPGTGNGFGELAAYDTDANQWIDDNDEVFSRLAVWTAGENGEKKLVSLKEAGVGAISLSYAEGMFNLTAEDNSLQGQVKGSGIFLFEDGRVGAMQQVDLVSHQATTLEKIKSAGLWEMPLQREGSGLIRPELQPMSMPEPPAEPNSPLEDLLEKIEKIKEEMSRLFEKADQRRSKKHRNSKNIKNYQEMEGVSSFLPFGRGRTRFIPGRQYF